LLTKALPTGVVATLGPDATGVGHVFWYTVEGKGYSLRDLRSLQDWFIRLPAQLGARRRRSRQHRRHGAAIQIDVDPTRLRAYKIPLSAVVDAVLRSNRNGRRNVRGGQAAAGRSCAAWSHRERPRRRGHRRRAEGGVPIFIKQVAQVKIGDAFRAAALIKGTDEAVGGVVVARYGVSTVDVINR